MTEIFKKISDINLEEKDSWKGKIFLTLDTDWAQMKFLIKCY